MIHRGGSLFFNLVFIELGIPVNLVTVSDLRSWRWVGNINICVCVCVCVCVYIYIYIYRIMAFL
jgi:hypothetical protein